MSRKSSKTNHDPRHDLSNDFVQALAADWKEHGAATIEAVRQKSPDKYCELIAKVVPKEALERRPPGNRLQRLPGHARYRQAAAAPNRYSRGRDHRYDDRSNYRSER